MSDYQTVQITKIEGPVVTLTVKEEDPDMDALAVIFKPDGQPRRGKRSKAVNFAALLLLDYNGRDNALCNAAANLDVPDARKLIADLSVSGIKPIGTSTNDTPLFEATLVVKVKKAAWLEGFVVDERWGAAASPDGDLEFY